MTQRRTELNGKERQQQPDWNVWQEPSNSE